MGEARRSHGELGPINEGRGPTTYSSQSGYSSFLLDNHASKIVAKVTR